MKEGKGFDQFMNQAVQQLQFLNKQTKNEKRKGGGTGDAKEDTREGTEEDRRDEITDSMQENNNAEEAEKEESNETEGDDATGDEEEQRKGVNFVVVVREGLVEAFLLHYQLLKEERGAGEGRGGRVSIIRLADLQNM